jgi:hypothetical protein
MQNIVWNPVPSAAPYPITKNDVEPRLWVDFPGILGVLDPPFQPPKLVKAVELVYPRPDRPSSCLGGNAASH